MSDDILNEELPDLDEPEKEEPKFAYVPHRHISELAANIDYAEQYAKFVLQTRGSDSDEYTKAAANLKTLYEARNAKRKDILTVVSIVLPVAGSAATACTAINMIARAEQTGCCFSSKAMSIMTKVLPGFSKVKV